MSKNKAERCKNRFSNRHLVLCVGLLDGEDRGDGSKEGKGKWKRGGKIKDNSVIPVFMRRSYICIQARLPGSEYGERKDEIVPGERDSAGKGAE